MKIKFKPLTKLDLADRVRWLSDPEVSQYLDSDFCNGRTMADEKKWFSKYMRDSSKKFFVIEVDHRPVGNVALKEIHKGDKNAGIFIMIGEKEYWGTGVATRALEYILSYGFNKLRLHKIWLQVCALNERAIRLYQKVGFIEEGRHTDMYRINQRFYDEIFMGYTNPKD